MKKRIGSCLMALAMVLSCTTVAFAASRTQDPISTPDTTEVVTSDAEVVPLSDLSFSFALDKGKYAYSNEIYNVKDENCKLHIISATWSLGSNAVWVGYYNVDTKKDYGVRYEGGSISNENITSEGLPDGSYRIIVKNLGPSRITGTIQYSVK